MLPDAGLLDTTSWGLSGLLYLGRALSDALSMWLLWLLLPLTEAILLTNWHSRRALTGTRCPVAAWSPPAAPRTTTAPSARRS